MLGAVVSPTDPVAATAIARRLGVPGRIVTIVEGESLVNDATALVAYKFAVAAVVTGSFSLLSAAGDFVVTAAGGIAVGIAIGAAIAFVRRRLDNPPVEVTIALFSAYFAYLPAEAIGVSGVLAAVTVGIYMGRLTSRLTTPTTRIQGTAVWEIVTFLLNSALFVLVGLQLPSVVDGISEIGAGELARDGLLVAATVVLIADRLRLPDHLRPPAPVASRSAPGALPAVAPHRAGRVDGHARRRLARRGARDPAHRRLGRRVSQARPDHLLHLLRDPGDAPAPGPEPAAADQDARSRRPRLRARAGGGERAPSGRRGRDPARGRARGRGMGPGRHGRAPARRLPLSPTTIYRAVARRRVSTAGSMATGSTTRPARSPISGSCARCSTPSA